MLRMQQQPALQPPPPYAQPQQANQQYTYVQPQPQPQQGCCSGYSETYNIRAGRTTGIIQLILGIVIVVVNVLTFVYGHMGYPNEGSPIGIGIFFAIPSGIIGITSKSRRNCVIIAYLVMSILSTVSGFGGVVTEGLAAGVFSYEYVCFYTFCYLDTFDVAIILHAVGAVLLLIESIVAIVASVYCCRGLKCCQGCCCHGDDTGNSSATPGVTATSVHYPQQPQGVVAYTQPETFVVKTTTPV
ncbi:uncharacterized protein LOC129282635 [Lytechinus pictus]|uniref:uncharacterized protein LOC129282635 n=1 Tax=Lytechinus pictus TaxID=7653 RepID=UPI0030BA19E1